MNRLMSTSFRPVLTIVGLLLLAGPSRSIAQEIVLKYEPQVGKPHPDFALPRIDDGKPLLLSELRGKKVLLLHFASW